VADKNDGTQFEVSVQKRGKPYSIDLWCAMTRGARGKKKLVAEAFGRDTETPVINFKINEGKDPDELFTTFVRLLVHRGFLPLKSRSRLSAAAPWTKWKKIDIDGVEGAAEVREAEGRG